MRTSPKRSIQEVIINARLARQANIDKFVNNKLEQVEVKLEPTNTNKRIDDLSINYFNVAKAILLGLSILTAVVFAVLIIGNK